MNWICPKAKECSPETRDIICNFNKEHEHDGYCDIENDLCPKCVPVPEQEEKS
jgi:hypothetical protein